MKNAPEPAASLVSALVKNRPTLTSHGASMCLYIVEPEGDALTLELPLPWFKCIADTGKALSLEMLDQVQGVIARYTIGKGDAGDDIGVWLSLYCAASKTYEAAKGFERGGHFVVARVSHGTKRILRPIALPRPGPLFSAEALQEIIEQTGVANG